MMRAVSLTGDLLNAGKTLPPSHVPSPSELPGFVGALASYIEHGATFLEAAAAREGEELGHAAIRVANILGGKPAEEPVAAVEGQIASDYDAVTAEINRLESLRATLPPATPPSPAPPAETAP
jgi:hypothetical protein